MVSVGGFGDSFFAGKFTCYTNRPRGHIRAVFAEYCPVRTVNGLGKFLCELYHVFGWMVEAVTTCLNLSCNCIYFGMVIAKQDRPVAAHQINV